MVELSSIVVSSRSVEEWLDEEVCSYGPQRRVARTICCTFKFFLPVAVLFARLIGRGVDVGTSSSRAGDAFVRASEPLAGVVTSVSGVGVAVWSVVSVAWASALVGGFICSISCCFASYALFLVQRKVVSSFFVDLISRPFSLRGAVGHVMCPDRCGP